MTGKTRRLKRLARAQGELVKVIEVAVFRAEQRVSSLAEAQAQLDSLALKASMTQLALLPQLLRSIAAMEIQVKQAKADLENLRQRRTEAKCRQTAVADRATHMSNTELRKVRDEEALETALVMGRKASRKGDVVM